MKHVLNARERNNALIVYILSFIVTVILIVGAVFFYTLIPEYENAILREKIKELEAQVVEQEPFIDAMEEVQHLTDSLREMGEINILVKNAIEKHLQIMDDPRHKEGKLFGTINKEIFSFLYDYIAMNEQIISQKDQQSRAEDLEIELRVTKNKLDEVNRDLDFLRKAGNLSAR